MPPVDADSLEEEAKCEVIKPEMSARMDAERRFPQQRSVRELLKGPSGLNLFQFAC